MGQGEDRYGVSRAVHFYARVRPIISIYLGFYGAFLMLLLHYSVEVHLYLDIRMVQQHVEVLVSITTALKHFPRRHIIIGSRIVKMKD